MKWFNLFSIRARLIGTFAVLLLLLSVVMALAWVNGRAAQTAVTNIVYSEMVKFEIVAQIDSLTKSNARNTLELFVVAPEERPAIRARMSQVRVQLDELFERLERKLEQYSGQLMRASVELAKDWRTDKYLRNLEALMIVADAETLLVLTGNGDVLEPAGDIAAIGSGGNYALAAARAIADYESDAETIARKAMAVAAEICVFTNGNLTVETV